MVRPVGAICGTDVPAVRLDFDQSDQLLNTFTLMPRGRESIQVQQQQVKKLRCERYIQPGNQRREPLVAFPTADQTPADAPTLDRARAHQKGQQTISNFFWAGDWNERSCFLKKK